jgi:hypothetical protein
MFPESPGLPIVSNDHFRFKSSKKLMLRRSAT